MNKLLWIFRFIALFLQGKIVRRYNKKTGWYFTTKKDNNKNNNLNRWK